MSETVDLFTTKESPWKTRRFEQSDGTEGASMSRRACYKVRLPILVE